MTNNDDNKLPERQHLKRRSTLFTLYNPGIFFLTLCSLRRKRILTKPCIAEAIRDSLEQSLLVYGWAVGQWVIMPDHVHFFCWPVKTHSNLSNYVRDLKKYTTRGAWQCGHQGKLWQREFFDHILRSWDSYKEKREYVANNPVRAGLCDSRENWKWQGEFEEYRSR